MSGRITSNMLSSDYLRNTRRNLNNMRTLQNQLSSGKEIQRVSDNPYKASRIMQLNTEMSYNKQFNENIKDTTNWLDTTDTALAQIGNVFGRIETLLVSAGNAAYGEDERIAIQDEIREKVNELSQILNTNFDGSYIFGGTKSGSKPTVIENGVLQYASTKGNGVNIYINSAGQTESSSVSANTALKLTDAVYLDSKTGKVTTSSTAIDGTSNTRLIPTASLYVKPDGTVTSDSSGGKKLFLKDDLYIDLNGNFTASKTTDNTLITSDDELFYLTPAGQVTISYDPTYTLIPTGTALYKDTTGNVTTSAAGNTKIEPSTPVYTDALGVVTTLPISINTKSSVTAVTDVKVSEYDKDNGYTLPQPVIDPSCEAYIDSRGVLTNSSTTDLSNRTATLENLWKNSYIDSLDHEKLKVGIPASTQNKQINLYKDSTGQVTTSPGAYPANEQILLGTTLYKNADGKVTTISGGGATPIQLTDTVYVDLNGDVVTNATVTNTPASVRDSLYVSTTDAAGKAQALNTQPADTVKVPSDAVTLYIDGSGNISKDSTGTKIVLGDSIYLDSYGNITTSKEMQNTLINSSDKLYYDANGNVTNSEKNIKITFGTTLYKDSMGKITSLPGGIPPNEVIDLENAVLYKDAKGNVTTLAAQGLTPNTLIDNKTSLYKDVNGNITVVDKNTQIASETQLYITDDGKSVTTEPLGYTFNELIAEGINIYRDSSGNLTTSAAGNIQITSANNLYEDPNGNIITLPGDTMSELMGKGISLYTDPSGNVTTSAAGNTLITSLPGALYKDSSGNVTISSTAPNTPIGLNTQLSVSSGNVVVAPQLNQAQNSPIPSTTKLYIDGTQIKTKLIKTGDPIYANSNGKIITSKTTPNTSLTINNKIYVDDSKNLTMSASTANSKITMSDVKSLKSELQSSTTTNQRKIEISKILTNSDVAELVQLDSDLTVDISQGVKSTYNKTVVDVLEFTDNNGNYINVSDLLKNIISDLGATGNKANITSSHLKNIQSVTQNLLQQRSEVGSLQNRMESAQANNETENYNITEILSKTEDIDWAEKTMDFSIMQTVYTASLQTSAKVLPQTILNYL